MTTILPRLLLVALGGALGSAGRYLVAIWSGQLGGEVRFPAGTLAVNLIGCLMIGMLAAFGERTTALSADARLFLMTGVLGGFTTFSAFGLETATMLRRDDFTTALVYVAVSVIGGLVAVWLGWGIAARVS
ncbi:MAG TPA: fluoride efflux transporter CrcB [Gemmatimonadales bacterium]|nr:fluoride efflux transporter CrcB [Gemmatimonadales bacterium]